MGVFRRALGLEQREEARSTSIAPLTFDQYLSYFTWNGNTFPVLPTTTLGFKQDEPSENFEGYFQAAYKSNGVIFACMLVRMLLFSEARFQFRERRSGRPGNLFGTPELAILETPWPNGTTGDLLARMIQDADLCGNFFAVRRRTPDGDVLRRLRPDWVTIAVGSMQQDATIDDVDAHIIGYGYKPGGVGSKNDWELFLPEQVVHFAPIPDPLMRFRGMSWLTPIVRELMADNAATTHKLKFFENGAAQPLDAKIATPHGWTEMGDIRVGDRVMGPDGKPRTVLGVYPQGEKAIYRLTFSNGAQTECCEDHLWQVASTYDRARGTARVLSLRSILADGVTYPSGAAKWSVPLTEPIEYTPPCELPMDPYLLGVLLGDGSFRGNGVGSGGISFSTASEDTDEMELALAPLVPAGVGITRRDRGGWSELYFRGAGGPRANPLTSIARDLDLFDVHGAEKVSPEPYMRAPVTDRVALLQGLIDTDGHVNRAPCVGVTFTNTSETLARQVRELALSLGGVASVAPAGARPNEPDRRQQWRVYINRLPSWVMPCRLERKRAAYRAPEGNRAPRHRYLQRVEYVGQREAQCIKVDAPDGLYVTDDFIVTHNTPNMVVKLDPQLTKDEFDEWIALFESTQSGYLNAYKTLYLGGGSDVQVVGADMRQIDFKATQGAGETRVAAAAGVPPVIVGLSEGLQASTYSNYSQARRRFADGTMRPLWRNACGSLSTILTVAPGAELWYDDRDIPFLAEDSMDAANVLKANAEAINTLVTAGFDPASAVDAVMAGDLARLSHTGMVSVQLLRPGQPPQNGTTNGSGNGSALVLPPGGG